ncbi:MAG: type II toxin-antitoxin system Phd/YefM family antitoxin [Acetobacteraceae bacterium]
MKEVGAFEAKTRLGQLLDFVEAGEEVAITRRGNVVAKLVPPGAPGIDLGRARLAARGLPAAPSHSRARRACAQARWCRSRWGGIEGAGQDVAAGKADQAARKERSS